MQNNDQNIATQDAGDEPPIPARYWWLKRLGVPIAALCACLVLIHVGMMIVTQRRIDALVKTYRDAGQPVLPEDFNPKSELPPERNAATLYKKAIEAYVLPASFPATLKVATLTEPDALREHHAIAAALISTNGQALEFVRRARSLTEVDWGDRVTSPILDNVFNALIDQRELTRLTGVAFKYQHLQGDDRESVEVMLDALHLASLTDAQPGMLIHHLLALSYAGIVAKGVEDIAPRLKIGDSIQAGADGHPASRDQIRALIDELLNTDHLHERWRTAVWSECAYALDSMTIVDNNGPQIGEAVFGGETAADALETISLYAKWQLLRPHWRSDTRAILQYFHSVAEAYLGATYPARTAVLPAQPVISETLLGELRMAIMYFRPFEGTNQLHFRGIAMRRMAAIALALRLYEIDHGSRPSGLDQLVPQYLWEIPLDPFAADERPIGYLLNVDKPLLYSVNLDGVDDGGEYELDKYGDVERRSKDLVFFLDGNRPSSAPPATQPASAKESDQQVELRGDDGQNSEDQDDAPQPGQRK